MVCIETFLPGALPRAPPHIHHGHWSALARLPITFPFIPGGDAPGLASSSLRRIPMTRNLRHSSRQDHVCTTVAWPSTPLHRRAVPG